MRLRIRDLREDADYTQEEVASYLHCDQSLYSKYERNEREIPWKLLSELANLYDTSVDYLIGRTNIKTRYPKE
ncbi:transcriptional regulator [Thermoanaerobacterium thermosaccharolyticum]|uniref:Transcriptional regulator n=1 Tax=Thermoanaerobacterium thermosaccharolyticum TaxID=1517 RepID=A0A231VGC0_THETR|nr:helix-turn-helix transcriptional regulator [Thermoanaerobacterium thermosaccharolyticum]OXT07233.1 transcriptional regulator [Thermoanaerobacterium thermosaccharolyticum]